MDLGGWLRSLGLERYEVAFREKRDRRRGPADPHSRGVRRTLVSISLDTVESCSTPSRWYAVMRNRKGEPGIGKSRIAETMVERISAESQMSQQQLDDALAQLVTAELICRRGTPPLRFHSSPVRRLSELSLGQHRTSILSRLHKRLSRDFSRTITAPEKPYIRYFLKRSTLWETIMTMHSTVLIALVLLIGATVPSIAEEEPDQTFTCTAKTFNECLMEAPCNAWKRSGPKAYELDTKIIFGAIP